MTFSSHSDGKLIYILTSEPPDNADEIKEVLRKLDLIAYDFKTITSHEPVY